MGSASEQPEHPSPGAEQGCSQPQAQALPVGTGLRPTAPSCSPQPSRALTPFLSGSFALLSALHCTSFPAPLQVVCLLPLPVLGSVPPVKQVALLPPTGDYVGPL